MGKDISEMYRISSEYYTCYTESRVHAIAMAHLIRDAYNVRVNIFAPGENLHFMTVPSYVEPRDI